MSDNSQHPRDPSDEVNSTGGNEPATPGANRPEGEEQETRPLDVGPLDEESIETARIEELSSDGPIESPTEPLPEEERRGPYDVVEYDIVEPPEDEEEADGFARIPAGPTEEVDYGEPRPRRARRTRDPRRASREGVREAKPAPAASKPRRVPTAAIVAFVIVVVLLFALILWLAGRPKDEAQSVPRSDAPATGEGR
jgi:hypothetical protein